MSAEIVTHPRSRRFVAILGSSGAWLVLPAIGERADERYRGARAQFDSLDAACRYARELAQHLGLEWELRPARGGGAGEAA